MPVMPQGWRLAGLSELLLEHDERHGDRTDLPALSLTKKDGLVPSKERFARVLHGKNVERYRVCRRNDFVVDPMLLWDGALARLKNLEAGFVSPDYRIFRPTGVAQLEFMDFLFRSRRLREAFKNSARGTNVRRNRIARSDFLQIPILLPPFPEQRRIAEILTSVDESIHATEAVIEQAREMRQHLLDQLLTRGIEHTQFRRTEIGEFPLFWLPHRLGDALDRIDAGRSPACPNEPASEGDWGVLKVSAIGRGQFLPGENKVLPDDYVIPVDLIVQAGDVLITRANTKELVGAVAHVPKGRYQLMLSDKTLRLVPRAYVLSEFLALTLQTSHARKFLRERATGTSSSMKNISQEVIRQTPFPVPSPAEQWEIANSVKSMDEMLLAEETTLENHLRLKAGLLQDLLSGRVRVKIPA